MVEAWARAHGTRDSKRLATGLRLIANTEVFGLDEALAAVLGAEPIRVPHLLRVVLDLARRLRARRLLTAAGSGGPHDRAASAREVRMWLTSARLAKGGEGPRVLQRKDEAASLDLRGIGEPADVPTREAGALQDRTG